MAKHCVSRYFVDWIRVICDAITLEYDLQKISKTIDIAHSTISG